MKISRHHLGLAIAFALGITLRFWHLDFKPLWLDEVITALITLGRSYSDVPVEVVFPISRLPEIFTFNSAATCPEIARTLATQSTHPPLFFCLMHAWVAKFGTQYSALRMVLRSLPALFGVGAIAAIYWLNRVAFSRPTGLMAAALMAVSPFGLYISQEARHYTLPVLLITLSLLVLIQIQQDIQQQKLRPIVWFSWVAINTTGLYVHYFYILALLAEFATLIVFLLKRQQLKAFFPTLPIIPLLAMFLPFAFFIPWLPILIGHFGRPETSWLPAPQNIAPLYQTIAAWLLMVIALPVENQPLWIAIPAGLLMIIFGGWLGWHVFQGIKQLWHNEATQMATLTLASFSLFVLLELLAIVYILGKDITIAPRYNFVYYPAICALIAAALVNKESQKFSTSKLSPTLLLVGILSCIFVLYGMAFQKPYHPQRVAQDMLREPNVSLMVVMGYKDSQDIALGLSFALGIDQFSPTQCEVNASICPTFAFFKLSPGYDSVWQNLSQLPTPQKLPLNLWVVAPGLRQRDYPPQLALSGQTNCAIDPSEYHRIGIPYQLYRCYS
ncbi:glycosyltransferase family 39 protein [Aerosakkonema funiforme]|uniref:Glycosyltransferase family 39 protein n=1 Tax=Aerosakkonema funiforme FACHB-1375 TaxID=2949571 RepID=A0A926VF84_9CYAN|nr:glycosyltransferase family 39 protein [Aerosakkonema funiforme]MBD2182672.1 glycosyltransferase family 39 protein [Aerosakkonema funiforme FACHB-1375]